MRHKLFLALVFALGLIALAALFAAPVRAAPNAKPNGATITVNTFTDEYNTGASCSLREAIQAANDNANFGGCTGTGYGDDTIMLPAGTYTITTSVGGFEDSNTEGDLDINSNITIVGASRTTSIIDGNGFVTSEGAFHVTGAYVFNISAVTIQNGYSDGSAIYNSGGYVTTSDVTMRDNYCGGGGGAIINYFVGGVVTVTNSSAINNCVGGAGGAFFNVSGATMLVMSSTLSLNTAPGNGGGIYNLGLMTVTNSTIMSNTAGSEAGGIYNGSTGVVYISNSNILTNTSSDNGGGIHNLGQLSVTGSSILSNAATNGGGGIYNQGQLTVTNGSIISNTASGAGGGIHNNQGGVSITYSTLRGNTSSAGGGGILNYVGFLTVTNSAIVANIALGAGSVGGGGIRNDAGGAAASLTLTNTTISGNKANVNGGGIETTGGSAILNLNNVTISNNKSDYDNNSSGNGGGVFHASGAFNLRNTIIAGNLDAGFGTPDCSALPTSLGYNLIGNSGTCVIAGPGDVSDVNALLAPLGNYGGPTQTHALYAGSPAINTGDNASCVSPDQRGVTRALSVGNPCDKGAFEGLLALLNLPLILK